MPAATPNLRPDPDPTLLTTENLRREIANLKELLESRLVGNHELISTEIQVLSKVTEERFQSIAIQFAERDKRTEQLSLADKTAIAAALQAQKEAAGATNESNSVALGKMEDNFTKLIDQGQTLLNSVAKNMDDKINDLRSRLDTGEGQGRGKTEGLSMAGAMIIGAAFVVSSIVTTVGFAISLSHAGAAH
jgi:hypothetical protein